MTDDSTPERTRPWLGAYRRAQIACVRGHAPDQLVKNPRRTSAVDPDRRLRFCIACARERARAQSAAIRAAALLLERTQRAYVAENGSSTARALAIIEHLEAEAEECRPVRATWPATGRRRCRRRPFRAPPPDWPAVPGSSH